MKFLSILLLCALGVYASAEKCSPGETSTGTLSDAAFWQGVDGGKSVEQLTDENHDTFIQENAKVFVMYYSPRCGYCVQSKKAFAGAAKKLNKGGVKIVAALDCTAEDSKGMCGPQVTGYPTFLLYKGGESVGEYEGQRTTAAFVKYVNQN